jgi:hypothetical protein
VCEFTTPSELAPPVVEAQQARVRNPFWKLTPFPFWRFGANLPLQEVVKELIEGLRFGFKLKYTGTRLPVLTKNSNSVSEHNEVVCRKINKEITMGRVDGPFNHSPMPTPRIASSILKYLTKQIYCQ